MLSPNTRNAVADSRGGANTRTVKLQEDDSLSASGTLHATVERPIGNDVPDPGEQANDNGSTPPDACGCANVTRTGPPFNDCDTTGAGHDTAGRGDALRFVVSTSVGDCTQPPISMAREHIRMAARIWFGLGIVALTGNLNLSS